MISAHPIRERYDSGRKVELHKFAAILQGTRTGNRSTIGHCVAFAYSTVFDKQPVSGIEKATKATHLPTDKLTRFVGDG